MENNTEETLVISNKRIINFYKSNPHIDFEVMNLLFLDFAEKFSVNNQKTVNVEILNSLKDIQHSVSSITNVLSLKFHEINREYFENVKLIIQCSSKEGSEKIEKLLDESTEVFLSQMRMEIPKSQEILTSKLRETLLLDIKQATANPNEIAKDIELKIQPIYGHLKLYQDQILFNLQNVKETNIESKIIQDKVMEQLGEFLNKYKTNSAFKGQSSENMLQKTLQKIFPMDEIVDSRAMKECGDFLLKRIGKKNVLIENKNYDLSISYDETKKFLRDVQTQKCNGVLMSQYSGIIGKPNFFIEVHDGSILVYVHNCEYDEDKIKMVIDVIDILSKKINELSLNDEENGLVISKELLEQINFEFQLFISKKENLKLMVKDFHKKMLSEIDNFVLPELSTYLQTKYASIPNKHVIVNCEICGKPCDGDKGYKSHKKFHQNKETKETTEEANQTNQIKNSKKNKN